MNMGEIINIIETLYGLNSMVSLRFIGLEQTPTVEDMMEINKVIGECIKGLREIVKEEEWR